MAKCFFTGIELALSDAYVLDNAASYQALKTLRQRVAALERLVQQLSPQQNTEVYDARQRKMTIRKDRRLVSPSVARVLSLTYPEKDLFLLWTEFRSRRLLQMEERRINCHGENCENTHEKQKDMNPKEICDVADP